MIVLSQMLSRCNKVVILWPDVLNFGNGLSTWWDKAAYIYLLGKGVVEIIIVLIEVQFCEYGRLESTQIYPETHSNDQIVRIFGV